MTGATRQARTVVEHRFIVPCAEPWGGTWDDFETAKQWALKKAEELGINTGSADWSRFHVEDDQLVIVLTETVSDHPAEPYYSPGYMVQDGDQTRIVFADPGWPKHEELHGRTTDVETGSSWFVIAATDRKGVFQVIRKVRVPTPPEKESDAS